MTLLIGLLCFGGACFGLGALLVMYAVFGPDVWIGEDEATETWPPAAYDALAEIVERPPVDKPRLRALLVSQQTYLADSFQPRLISTAFVTRPMDDDATWTST